MKQNKGLLSTLPMHLPVFPAEERVDRLDVVAGDG